MANHPRKRCTAKKIVVVFTPTEASTLLKWIRPTPLNQQETAAGCRAEVRLRTALDKILEADNV
jgi:hypothetical protein